MNNLQLENKHLKILKEILAKYPYKFYAYGSRVKGTAKKYSDLDLCYYDVPRQEISKLREELTKSNLPFFVEVVAWKRMRPTFRELISKDLTTV